MRSFELHNRNMWKNAFEIMTTSGDSVAHIRAKSLWSMQATVEGQHDEWEFKSDAWMLKYKILDRTGHPIGTAKSDWTHTKWTIDIKGETYKMTHYHWASTIYILSDSQGNKLVSVKMSHWGKPMGSIRTYGEQDPRQEELLMSLLAYIARRMMLNGYS